MKDVYVKVTGAEKPSYWYSDKIGKVFKVTGLHPSKRGFLVYNDHVKDVYWIAWEECLPATKQEYLESEGRGG